MNTTSGNGSRIPDKETRIVILGGGFGGIYAVRRLERRLAGKGVSITLVNRDNYFLFTPMLHEVATSDLDPTHIVNPIRKLLRRVDFFAGRVESVDLDARTVLATHGGEHHLHALEFDHLVIALGSVNGFFDLPGVESRALPIKTLEDAIRLRGHIIQKLEEADVETEASLCKAKLTFVVVGGGFAGVETAGGINDFVRESLRFYRHLDETMVRMVLIDGGPMILPELGPVLGRYAARKLTARGIEIRSETRVLGASDQGVQLSTGETIATESLIWAAGTAPNPLVVGLPCPHEKGRILVDEGLEVVGRPGVWALGDCALIRDPRSGQPYPPTAQHAVRQGKILARNIEAAIRGGAKRPFVFKTLGLLATIGRRAGVARVLGINFSGFLAWGLWRAIYLSKLPRLEKKIRVGLDWLLDLFFSKDLVQYTTNDGVPTSGRTADSSRLQPAPGAVKIEGVQR